MFCPKWCLQKKNKLSCCCLVQFLQTFGVAKAITFLIKNATPDLNDLLWQAFGCSRLMQLKPTFPNERFFPLSGESGAAEANECGRFKAEHYSCSPHIWDHRCALGVQAGRSLSVGRSITRPKRNARQPTTRSLKWIRRSIFVKTKIAAAAAAAAAGSALTPERGSLIERSIMLQNDNKCTRRTIMSLFLLAGSARRGPNKT
jgi:hypothetical protein